MNNTSTPIHLNAIIPETLAGLRLDQALSQLFPEHSRARLQAWIRDQHVLVNGAPARTRDKVRGGEQVHIETAIETQALWQAQAIDLDIIYEDESLLVINKPVGLVVHPAAGNWQGTLVNALLHHCPDLKNLPRAGVVHRLDKETSGLLVIAKTMAAHTHLVRQLQARTMKRSYQAVVNGVLTAGGKIDAAVGRHPRERKRMAVLESGKLAVTHYRVLERYRAHTLINVFLETGRTHQIRVHMAHIHHPLLGDPVYGGRLQLPKQASEKLIQALRQFRHQALHAYSLGLEHPHTHEPMEWTAPLPADFQELIAVLQEDAR